jgi:predicted permease
MRSFRRLFQRRALEETLDWEIQHHIDEHIDELLARGLTRAEAEREAQRAFGDAARFRHEMRVESEARLRRQRWSDRWDGLRWDLRLAVRALAKRPVVAALVILVLGLGIGANTAIFSALRAALLQSPPYPDPDRLVLLDVLLTQADQPVPDTLPWSYPKFDAMQKRMRTVAPVAGFSTATATLTGAGEPARVGIEYVSPTYFDLLGVRPVRGNTFDAGQVPPAPGDVVLLSHEMWTGRLGRDPHVVGRTLRLDGATLRIAGVLPAEFRGLSGSADVWVPLAGIATVRGPRRLQLPWAHWLRVVGRLQPGVTLEHARQEAARIGPTLDASFPAPAGGGQQSMSVVELRSARVNSVARLAISAISMGALLLLLIACGNVGSLMLARASARRTDLAVRAALGAGRWRLVRESLLESLLLAAAGGALGLLMAYAGQHLVAVAVRYALNTSGTRSLQFFSPDALHVNGGVLLFGLALALGTGLLYGLLPARAAGATDVARDLRAGGRSALRAATGVQSGRSLLVTLQLAMTVVLVAGAVLMGASFARLSRVAIGFNNQNVLSIGFNRGTDTSPEQDRVFEQQLLARVATLPGVLSTAVAPCAPLTAPCEITALQRIDDRVSSRSDALPIITYAVSDDYFRTLGISVRQGRAFGVQDAPAGSPVVILNETAAQRLFPEGSALGHRLAISHALTEERMATIIGVVADVQYGQLEQPMAPTVYLATRQAPSSYGTLFVHTDGDPLQLLAVLRREIATLDPDLPLEQVTTMRARHTLATARTRVVLGLFAAFALSGLLLSAIGLYGLVSFSVQQRTREMGLRLALGASAGNIIRLVLRGPLLLAGLGVSAGIAAALIVTRYVRDLLYNVEPSDPRVLFAAALALSIVATTAALVPARRATRAHPADSLRSD